jgi:hypothetical protein
MKTIILAAFIFATTLSACTSEEKKQDNAAIEAATEQFKAELKEELAKAITGKTKIQFTAVDIISKRTEFSITKKEMQGDQASVEVHAKTISPKVKTALIEIMVKLEDKNEARFNVSDALKLIHQQMGLTPADTSTQIYNIKLKKDGEWKKAD